MMGRFAPVDQLTGKTQRGGIQSTGKYLRCPPGQIVMERVRGKFGKPDMYICGLRPAPQPVRQSQSRPPSPTHLNLTTTINPNFQQSFTPQVSPNLQVNTGSGSQTAGAQQVAPGGQRAGGANDDLLRALIQNQQSQAARFASEQRERRERETREREERERREKREQEQRESQRQADLARFQQSEGERARQALRDREALKQQFEAQQEALKNAPSSNTIIRAPVQPPANRPAALPEREAKKEQNFLPYYIGGGALVLLGIVYAASNPGRRK